MRSSGSSSPRENLKNPSGMPACARWSAVRLACEVRRGSPTRGSAPPRRGGGGGGAARGGAAPPGGGGGGGGTRRPLEDPPRGATPPFPPPPQHPAEPGED